MKMRRSKMGLGDYREKALDFLASDTKAATITKIVLAAVALGGIIFVAGVAPNLFSALGKLSKSKSRRFSESQINSAYYHLKKQGLILARKRGSDTYELVLTDKGRTRVLDFDIDTIRIKKPWQWDGKWRIVMYDIPVRFRVAREAFRWKLKELGLVQMQKSVWLYPYDCLNEIMFVANYFGVRKCIDYMEVSRMTHSKKFGQVFETLNS